MVHPGGQSSFKGMRDQGGLRNHHRRTSTRPRRWPRPSKRSPASRSTIDLIQEGDVVEKLQTQCSRARTSTTAGSTTPT
ncbi:MAG: hypothetical protein MZV70_56690 [Desulfobacterales bacterium]|nr:hypothetical protein [Desulfobacterales bacterium]